MYILLYIYIYKTPSGWWGGMVSGWRVDGDFLCLEGDPLAPGTKAALIGCDSGQEESFVFCRRCHGERRHLHSSLFNHTLMEKPLAT